MTTRKYTLKVPRFDPLKNVFVGFDVLEKYCTKCKSYKSIQESFNRDPKRELGYYSHCRECQNNYGFKRRQKILSEKFDGVSTKKCRCGHFYSSIGPNNLPAFRCQKCARSKTRKKA